MRKRGGCGVILIFCPLIRSRRTGFDRASVRRHLLRGPNLLEEQPTMRVRTYSYHLLRTHLACSAVEPLEHSRHSRPLWLPYAP